MNNLLQRWINRLNELIASSKTIRDSEREKWFIDVGILYSEISEKTNLNSLKFKNPYDSFINSRRWDNWLGGRDDPPPLEFLPLLESIKENLERGFLGVNEGNKRDIKKRQKKGKSSQMNQVPEIEDIDKLSFEEKKSKCLDWCQRHCCWCEKDCAVNIEIHHIDRNEDNNSIDNLIPLCFDCHSSVEHYDPNHPRGTKIKPEELKRRRNLIYKKYTEELVQPFPIFSLDSKRELPSVGTSLKSNNKNLIKVYISLHIKLGEKDITGKFKDQRGYYTGKTIWHLNPTHWIYDAHFTLPLEVRDSLNLLKITADMVLIDELDYWHNLSMRFAYNRTGKYWFVEP